MQVHDIKPKILTVVEPRGEPHRAVFSRDVHSGKRWKHRMMKIGEDEVQ